MVLMHQKKDFRKLITLKLTVLPLNSLAQKR